MKVSIIAIQTIAEVMNSMTNAKKMEREMTMKIKNKNGEKIMNNENNDDFIDINKSTNYINLQIFRKEFFQCKERGKCEDHFSVTTKNTQKLIEKLQ